MRWPTCILALTALLLAACGHTPPGVDDPRPAVYYWRTVFKLDSVERAFLRQHHVGKIYLRYFDVVPGRQGAPVPNATLRFAHSVPRGVEVVPVVFITENCLHHGIDSVATLLVDRVLQISDTHDVGGVKELQIDCDWTARSRQAFYHFLTLVRERARDKGLRLSATIRLHQLAMEPPPVDYGVLMLYNTGDVTRHDCANPILDPRDVEPYLRHLAGYALPLCAAYPCFAWNVLFDGDSFKGILYDAPLHDSTLLLPAGAGKWVVAQHRDLPQFSGVDAQVIYLNAGDSLLHRQPAAAAVERVKAEVERRRPGIHRQVVIYSLDSKSILNYPSSYYEKIYHP